MLGLFSLIASFFTVMATVTAAVGVALGVWGLYSPHRKRAVVGLLLCCLALAIGGFNGIVTFYEYQYRYKPSDSRPPSTFPKRVFRNRCRVDQSGPGVGRVNRPSVSRAGSITRRGEPSNLPQ